MYSHFRASSSVCPLHTAITHVIEVLELWGISHANCQWNSREAAQFQYMSDCSAQYVQTGLEALKRPYTVSTWYTFVTRGCHGHAESVSVSVSVLCSLKMTMQLLYVASVGLKSPLYVCIYMQRGCQYMLVLSSSFRCNNAVLLK